MSGWSNDPNSPTDPRNEYGRPSWEPSDPGEHYQRPALRHSGPGIASTIIGILTGVFLFGLIVVAGVMEESRPGGIDENSPEAMIIGLLLFAGIGMGVVGVALDIVGVLLPNRSKTFGIVGLAINALVALGAIGLTCAGLLMGA